MSGVTIGPGAVVETALGRHQGRRAVRDRRRRAGDARSAGASATSRSRRCCGSRWWDWPTEHDQGSASSELCSPDVDAFIAPTIPARDPPANIPLCATFDKMRRAHDERRRGRHRQLQRRAAAARLPRRAARPDARARGDRSSPTTARATARSRCCAPTTPTSACSSSGTTTASPAAPTAACRDARAVGLRPELRRHAGARLARAAHRRAARRTTWALGSVLVSARRGRIESAGDQYDAGGLRLQAPARPAARRAARRSPTPSSPRRARRRSSAATSSTRSAATRSASSSTTRTSTSRSARSSPATTRCIVPAAARHPPARRDDALARPRALLRRAQQRLVRRALPARDGAAARSSRRWLSELRTNRPRRLVGVELAGRAAGLAGLPRALRERREIQDARVPGLDELGVFLQPPRRSTSSGKVASSPRGGSHAHAARTDRRTDRGHAPPRRGRGPGLRANERQPARRRHAGRSPATRPTRRSRSSRRAGLRPSSSSPAEKVAEERSVLFAAITRDEPDDDPPATTTQEGEG